jgi:hypothetical protein
MRSEASANVADRLYILSISFTARLLPRSFFVRKFYTFASSQITSCERFSTMNFTSTTRSLFVFVLLCLFLAGCNRCNNPVTFQVVFLAGKSNIVLDLDNGEFKETFTLEGSTDPGKPIILKEGYCSSDSLIHVKYTLNGMDTAFVLNRNQVKICTLGDKINKKPGAYLDFRKEEKSKEAEQ